MTGPKRVLLALGLLASMPFSAAAADTLVERFERTLPFASGRTLQLASTNGNVSVESWDVEQIEIVAEKKVRARSDEEAREVMEEVRIEIEETDRGVAIETRIPRRTNGWLSGRDASASVSYTIRIPEHANLDLETVNGKVRVAGVHGNLDLGSTNGGIRALESGGSVRARTTNGGIEVELATIEAGEEMSFETTNGPIEISLPGHVAANLTARTTNGNIETDFPVTIKGSMARNRLTGEINGGGASIELRTTNGSIRIHEI